VVNGAVGRDSVVTAATFDALGSRDERAVGIEVEPMRQGGTVEAAAPARTDRPLRQIVVSLCFTYAMALAIALALPHAGIAPLISIAVPVTAVALAVTFTVPPGGRGEIWAGVGFKPRRGRGLLTAVMDRRFSLL
jgi:hypothetical protein